MMLVTSSSLLFWRCIFEVLRPFSNKLDVIYHTFAIVTNGYKGPPGRWWRG